ncbi:MAG: signal peptidase II [Clostridiales Family XIII bacterium]|jgi:signal peptidase II|nr:signal peptidase II [Clostridiales Family XIII bacterium]
MKFKKALPLCILITLLVIALDHLTKYLIRVNMSLGQAIPSPDSFFSIRYTLNDGVAFSMLEGHRIPLILMQSVLVVCIIVLMCYLLRKINSRCLLVAFSFMLGGGIGNLIDRIVFGQVTDFLSAGKFPVFNLADTFLTIGCALMLLWVILSEKRHKADETDEPA